jgi:hypothetical protein
MRLYVSTSLYPDVTDLTSCLTSVYHAKTAVERSELGAKLIVLVVEACETITCPPVYAEGRIITTVANIPLAFWVLKDEDVQKRIISLLK